MKKVIIFLSFILLGCVVANAQDFHIIPDETNPNLTEKDVKDIGNFRSSPENSSKDIWDVYNEKAYNKDGESRELWDRLASWVLTWDDLLDYVVYLVMFLSQIGLVVWAVMIIYAWYSYASYIFSGTEATTKPIKYAIIGVVVVSFSYAIIKILTNMFL